MVLTELSSINMNNSITNKNLNKYKLENLDWNSVQSQMKIKLGTDIYESWLKKIDFIEEFNNYILLSVPTRFIRDWITSRYLDQILQIIKNYKKNIIRIEFKIVEQNVDDNKKIDKNNLNFQQNEENISFIKDSYLQYNRIDPNKKFENFITGPSNKLAYEASIKVSENISHYNPLYIYGGVGMGKTHLLNSIGLQLKKTNKVMFISAERFMYQFVKSIKNNDMVKFKEYFRNTDILLIDDIQFMNGKEAMQEEFFHTFNALLDKGSQIIVSADRAPNKLSRIQERIKSRFSGGLVVDIQKPDVDLRKKIVEKKTEELNHLYAEEFNISREIMEFISVEITNSVRELVGAVNRIVSFSRIYNKIPNLAETKMVLKDLLNLTENKVTIDLIQTIVCKFFKISKNEMLSSRRSRYLVRPRQTAIYLTKILTSKSLPEIGREFSNRDHTTIIHSVKTIEKLKEKNPEMIDNINKLKNQILYNNKENEI
jgi:chromosomal replication initiator protein